MAAKTRLGEGGYGVRRYGSFSGKTLTVTGHPKTRLGEGGYGVRRYSSFAGKASTVSASTKRPTLFIANVGRLMN